MSPLRRHRRWVSWLALLSLVLATLAPAIGQAAAALNGDVPALGAICTADGPKTQPGQVPAPGHGAFELCAFCSIHAPVLGLPPPAVSGLPAATGRTARAVRAVATAPRAQAPRANAQPRAPPLVS